VAVPTFVAVGTSGVGAGGGITPTWPSHQADDIGVLLVQTSNQAVSFSNAAGFVEITDSPQGTGVAGAAGASRLSAYWCRATSGAMTDPVLNDSGDHTFCYIAVFRGCIASGNPWDVTSGDTGASDTAVSIPGDTTTVADCLIVAAVAHAIDATTAQVSGWANADLANVAERRDASTNTGNGGGVGIATGEKAAAGAYGVTTATLDAASLQGRMSIALKPPAGGSVTMADLPVITIGLSIGGGIETVVESVASNDNRGPGYHMNRRLRRWKSYKNRGGGRA
jgi:hypothetical protein